MRSRKDSASVLIGISTHNRADILPKALRSALSQSHPSIEVGVVDDASSDATPQVARRFPQVQWTRWDANQGYVAARNHLMLNSTADYYVSLDDDAWFMEGDEIALAVDLLEQKRDVAAVAFDILSPDRPTPARRQPSVAAGMFIGCGHVLRLDVVRALNGYASFPGSYGGEEKDLCLRLLDAEYQIVMLPGVHVWHDKTLTARDLAAQHRSGVCNDLTLTLRRTPFVLLPFALIWKLARHLQFAARTKLVAQYCAGVRGFVRSIPSSWRGRQPVKLRTLSRFSKLTQG
jgi:GT2 family glycosyltransferase